MLWNKDALWSKACVYIERGLKEDRGNELFVLWYALAFEFLLRSTVAHVSPSLLADREWKNVLYSVNGSILPGHKAVSRQTKEVLDICKSLVKDVDKEIWDFCDTLIYKRNEELHTGACSFTELGMSTQEWLARYYRACHHLASFQEESLNDLLGEDEGVYAVELVKAHQSKVKKTVLDLVSKHCKMFKALTPEEVARRTKAALHKHRFLRTRNHHQVACPACQLPALISGEGFHSREPELRWDSVVEKQEAIARCFECFHCELKIVSLEALLAAGIPTTYLRTITHHPADYFDLQGNQEEYQEYDNE